MELVERVARLEERVSFMAATLSEACERLDDIDEERAREHGRAAAVAETAGRAAARASSRERRWFAAAGIALTVVNVVIPVVWK